MTTIGAYLYNVTAADVTVTGNGGALLAVPTPHAGLITLHPAGDPHDPVPRLRELAAIGDTIAAQARRHLERLTVDAEPT